MSRYLVVRVHCLECNQGEACPELVVATDDLSDAIASAANDSYTWQSDKFVIDTATGSFIKPNTMDYKKDAA